MHKPEFKAKVALTAVKGEMTLADMVKNSMYSPLKSHSEKKQLLNTASGIFDQGDKAADGHQQEVLELRAKDGQLTMENDFLERGLERIHGPRGKKW